MKARWATQTVCSGLCVLVLVSTAQAAESHQDSPSQQQTENWLQLQASGKAASSHPQPASPAERDLSMQRWLDSYKHPIPEFYEEKKSGGSSSGSR